MIFRELFIYLQHLKQKGLMMKITQHAAQRFLQRVMNKKEFTKQDMYRAYKFLEAETRDIAVNGYKKYFTLPSFQNYRAVVVENSLVTIMPKNWMY
jgi:hypothetical protein